MLEALAERQAVGKGVLTEADLAALGVSLGEAKALSATLKTARARKPDRDGRPKAVKDSPFAALVSLSQPAPPSRRKRRPRRSAK